MKYRLLTVLTAAVLFLMPAVTFGQAITLGTTANFVLFTTNGAVTNSGIPHLTHLTGNVGSNLAGSISGFGNVDGQMHAFDGVTGACVVDVNSLYAQLNAVTPTAVHPVLLGGGETLVPGVYHILANTTLNTILTLDAGGNPNAVFIFQIDGTFSTTTLSNVKLINGGLACNVFWKVEGLISVASGTTLRGTFVAHNAAINMGALDTLEGRMLSINGAVGVSQLMAYTPIGCGSAVLTGPAAPALVSAAQFGIFSSIGGVTSTPITYVIGDVGSNSTTTTGFNPLNVTGVIHTPPDAATAAAAGSLTNAYNYLVALPTDIELLDPANFGYDLVLTPHTYHLGALTQFTGNVILNAEGTANAVFVIKVDGAFTTGTLSRVILINGAQAKNVYWKIDGAVHIFPNSLFNGTIVAAGAITLDAGDTLNGRALTIGGAVAINGSYVTDIPAGCVASPISGSHNVCTGSTTTLSDADGSGIWSSSNTNVTVGSSSGMVTGINPGNTLITYTSSLACSSTFTMTVSSGPSPITGTNSVCIGSTINLSDITPGGAWSSSNTSLATVGTGSGIVTGVASGTPTITYTIPSGCIATKTLTVGSTSNAGNITGLSDVCVGSTITLSDPVTGGIWSSNNSAVATIGSASGIVSGVIAGSDIIRYVVTGSCGTATATTTITVSTSSNPGTITGPSGVCVGSSITLSENVTGGTWSSSNTTATVINGVVTGASAGTDIISYSVNNGCGLATTTKTITVNASPNAGTINGPSSVCTGSSIILSDGVIGGIWSSSNTTATVVSGIVTGITAGTDTIMYTVTNVTCTATATKIITVSVPGSAGSISGPSSVCAGFSITLSDNIPGGTWSASNTTATVSGSGVVTGTSAGINTISYSITNGCGTAISTKTITVNPLPDAGNITGPSSVCVGSSIILSEDAAGGAWSSSNGNATVLAGVVTGVSTGTDIIMYTVSNSCGTIVASKFITISSSPSAGNISGPSSVCVGSSIILSDGVIGGTWSGSNTTVTVLGGVVTGNTTGTDVITYTVNNGCGIAVTTKTITVNPLPDASNITGPSGVCIGATINLSDNVTGGTWSSSNANATVSGGVVTGVNAGANTISYAITNLCGTSTAIKNITVSPAPNAGTITGPSSVCIGSSITLNNATTGGTWSINNARATVTPLSVGIMVTGITAGLDTIMYTVTNACGTDIAIRSIVVNPIPLVPVITTQAPSTTCTGTMYQNYGTAIPPQTGTTYNWTATNAIVWAQGTLHQYSLVSFTAPGAATVTLNTTLGNGCSSKSTVAVNVGSTVNEIPVVSYFNNHFVCTPDNEASYQWGYDDTHSLDSTILTGEINQDYINTTPDFANKNYWAMTTMGSCIQKTYYSIPTELQSVNNEVGISVYPNPANTIINVTITSADKSNTRIEVLNMMGQTVSAVQSVDNKATIDVTALPSGYYLIGCYRGGIKIAGSRFTKN